MSKINDLIKELCPNGVKFYKLSDIGKQFTGLSGKSKKDFENGKQYMDVRYEMINYSKTGDIRDEITNYQLYIDNELIEMADF